MSFKLQTVTMFQNGQYQHPYNPTRTFEMEPSLHGGYCALYDNKIPIDIKYIDYDRNIKHLGKAEFVLVRIFTYGLKTNISKIKLEIDSDYDPFFNLVFECDQQKYEHLKKQQTLTMDFQDFPTLFIKCFNKVEELVRDASIQKENYTGRLNISLLIGSDGKAKLTITQSSEYKNIDVVSVDFSPENEQNLEQKVSYRYGELKKKVAQTEERLSKIQELIRQNNPTLLSKICKTTANKLNISEI